MACCRLALKGVTRYSNSVRSPTLISADALANLNGEIEVRTVAPVQAKGKSQPIEVFEVVGMS